MFDVYKVYGIRLKKTPSKTPQNNGVAERMNIKIEERVQCILSHAKLPNLFWGEAARTVI